MTKTCTKCHCEKPLTEFYKKATSKDGLTVHCKQCIKQYNSSYYEDNSDSVKKRSSDWKENNKQAARKTESDWRKRNKDKVREFNRRWDRKNIALVNAKTAKRRSAKINSTPSWLSAIHRAQIQEFYDIALARSTQTGIVYHVDHIHPLQGKGFNGLHVPWNLQILSEWENCRKSNKLPSEAAHLSWGLI